MAGFLEVGRVARAHGLRGEVIVELVTNRLERVAVGAVLEAERPSGPGARRRAVGGDSDLPAGAGHSAAGHSAAGHSAAGHSGPGPGAAEAEETGRRQLLIIATRPHLGRHLVFFEGVSSREAADELHGWRLLAPALEGAGDLFVHELIGSELFEASGERRGVVTAVEANPASDLLVVDERWYVPMRFVLEHRDGRVVVDAPEGLFE